MQVSVVFDEQDIPYNLLASLHGAEFLRCLQGTEQALSDLIRHSAPALSRVNETYLNSLRDDIRKVLANMGDNS